MARRHRLPIHHQDIKADRWPLMCQLLDDGKKRTVEAEHAVFGMVDDVGDLAWDQPRIDRMPYRAKTGDAVFDFEMPVVVPGQRRDPTP